MFTIPMMNCGQPVAVKMTKKYRSTTDRQKRQAEDAEEDTRSKSELNFKLIIKMVRIKQKIWPIVVKEEYLNANCDDDDGR